jgi:hypothetical protein
MNKLIIFATLALFAVSSCCLVCADPLSDTMDRLRDIMPSMSMPDMSSIRGRLPAISRPSMPNLPDMPDVPDIEKIRQQLRDLEPHWPELSPEAQKSIERLMNLMRSMKPNRPNTDAIRQQLSSIRAKTERVPSNVRGQIRDMIETIERMLALNMLPDMPNISLPGPRPPHLPRP